MNRRGFIRGMVAVPIALSATVGSSEQIKPVKPLLKPVRSDGMDHRLDAEHYYYAGQQWSMDARTRWMRDLVDSRSGRI